MNAPKQRIGRTDQGSPAEPDSRVLRWKDDERVVAALVWVCSLALFSSSIDGHPSLGDSPESVAGIDVWGILHAPGYPAYVVSARIFGLLVPFGSLAFRVALFSAAVSAGTVLFVYLLARRAHCSRLASVIGCAVFATGTSTWFYAGFEKHNAFTGFLVGAVVLSIVIWADTGRRTALVLGGIAAGALAGSSWQMCLIVAPAVAVAVLLARRADRVRALVLASLVAIVVAIAAYGFVAVRAGAEPPVNWGRATTVDRLSSLVTMEDFGFSAEVIGRSDGSGRSIGAGRVSRLPRQFTRYGIAITREIGVIAVLVAVVGLAAGVRRRRTRRIASTLAVLLVTNLVATSLAVGIGGRGGFAAILVQGGFLVGAFLALGVGTAMGLQSIDELAAGAARRSRGRPLNRTSRGRPSGGRSSRTNGTRSRANRSDARRPLGVAAVATLGVVMVVPSVAIHRGQLERRAPDYAGQYAANVFASLPDDAVLLVWGSERGFPLIHAQVVAGARPDVEVITADGLAADWYVEDASDRLGWSLPARPPDQGIRAFAATVAADIEQRGRPVFVDVAGAQTLREQLGYVPNGLVARFVDGSIGAQPVEDVDALATLIDDYDLDDVYDHPYRFSWPNGYVQDTYVRMHLELARGYVDLGRFEAARRQISLALEIDPQDPVAGRNLDVVEDVLAGR